MYKGKALPCMTDAKITACRSRQQQRAQKHRYRGRRPSAPSRSARTPNSLQYAMHMDGTRYARPIGRRSHGTGGTARALARGKRHRGAPPERPNPVEEGRLACRQRRVLTASLAASHAKPPPRRRLTWAAVPSPRWRGVDQRLLTVAGRGAVCFRDAARCVSALGAPTRCGCARRGAGGVSAVEVGARQHSVRARRPAAADGSSSQRWQRLGEREACSSRAACPAASQAAAKTLVPDARRAGTARRDGSRS